MVLFCYELLVNNCELNRCMNAKKKKLLCADSVTSLLAVVSVVSAKIYRCKLATMKYSLCSQTIYNTIKSYANNI